MRHGTDPSGPLEDTLLEADNAAEMNAKAALMDCDSALQMQPGHVKVGRRRSTPG